MADFDALSATFRKWFVSQPGATYHDHLEISDLRHRAAGRGIVALKDIAADTDLFTIPRNSVINVLTSELSKKLPSLFESSTESDEDGNDNEQENSTEMPRPWLNLILVLIYEFIQGEKSAWKPYLDVLPETSSLNTLMFWSGQELEELQASTVRSKIGKTSADQMFKSQILPVINRNEDVFYPPQATKLNDDDLLQFAHRAGSLIMAYAFDLENDDEEEQTGEEDGWVEDHENLLSMGMVPMADMLNADAEFNAHLSHGDEALTMTSLRPIRAGEEVLNYYGPLPNCELLRKYGYTSTKHARYDVVEIPWDLIKTTLEEYWKDKGHKNSLTYPPMVDEIFILEREAGNPDDTGKFLNEARFTTFDEEMVEQINEVNAAALNIALTQPNMAEVEKNKLKRAFLNVMEKVLAARVAQYSTSIEEDEKLLNSSDGSGRYEMAIRVRLGEKKLLMEAAQLVADLKSKYNYSGTSEPPAKKRKT